MKVTWIPPEIFDSPSEKDWKFREEIYNWRVTDQIRNAAKLANIIQSKSIYKINKHSLDFATAEKYASIVWDSYDGKLKSIQKNPFAKVPKDKKLSSGKEVNSIFPLSLT